MANLPRLLPLIAIAIGGVVAVKAVGAGPGLFEGAKAWAEEAMPASSEAAGAAPKVVPAVCALTPEQLAQQAGVSPAELRILQSLSARRTQLDARDTDFATMLPLMATAEAKLDAKIAALESIKGEVKGLLGQVDEKEKAETDRLVAVYSAMRPKEAAAIFSTLDDSVRLPIAAAMRPRALSAVMAQMRPVQADELTRKLAQRYQAQQLAARAAVAGAPAAAAAQAAAVPAAGAPVAAAGAAPKPQAQAVANAAPATPPASAALNAANAATPPEPTPAVSRPAARPATRPAARPQTPRTAAPRSTAKPAAGPASTGPQPYTPAAATPASASPTGPRQSVQ